VTIQCAEHSTVAFFDHWGSKLVGSSHLTYTSDLPFDDELFSSPVV